MSTYTVRIPLYVFIDIPVEAENPDEAVNQATADIAHVDELSDLIVDATDWGMDDYRAIAVVDANGKKVFI